MLIAKLTAQETILKKEKPDFQAVDISDIALNRLIDGEYEAHSNNEALLYRAVRPSGVYIIGKGIEEPYEAYFFYKASEIPKSIEDLKKQTYLMADWSQPLTSLSYGLSFFASYFSYKEVPMGSENFQRRKALYSSCACDFMRNPLLVSYFMKISKNTKKLENYFVVPPVNTLLALFSRGEYFHARSVSALDKRIYDEAKQQGRLNKLHIPGLAEGTVEAQQAPLFLRQTNPLEQAAFLASYVAKNGQIFKVPEETPAEQDEEKINTYKEAQNDFASMLKALSIVRKRVAKGAGST